MEKKKRYLLMLARIKRANIKRGQVSLCRTNKTRHLFIAPLFTQFDEA